MTVCLVCAQGWQEKEDACASCGTGKQDLEQMLVLAGKVRFLFGSTEMPTPTEEAQPKPKATPRAKPRAKPKVTPAPKPSPTKPVDADMDPDIIGKRDVSVSRESTPKAKGHGLTRYLFAYGLDVAICLFLNYWVIRLILLFSTRSLEDLVTFSLIPVLFVLLFFSFLYFWLFFSLFRKTLGCLIWERLRRGPAI